MRGMLRNSLPACVAFVFLGSASAEPPASIQLASALGSSETDQKTIRLEVDPQAWHRLFRSGSARVSGFPLPGGRSADLTLSSFDVTTRATRFVVADKDGMHETTGPVMRFFRGNVDGDPDSVVSLTLFGGRIAGFIRTDGSEFTWHPRSFSPDAEGSQEISVFDDGLEAEASGCDGDDPADDRKAILPGPGDPSSAAIGPDTLLTARVAVEGTVEWVARHGGVAGAQLYTLNLISQVSAVYESEVSVQIQVPYVLMNAAETDGYSGSSNSTSTILPELRAKWNGSSALRGVFRSA